MSSQADSNRYALMLEVLRCFMATKREREREGGKGGCCVSPKPIEIFPCVVVNTDNSSCPMQF